MRVFYKVALSFMSEWDRVRGNHNPPTSLRNLSELD